MWQNISDVPALSGKDNNDYSKPVLNGYSKRTPNIGFQYLLSDNAGQKYCRMLQGEHSAILLTSIKQPLSLRPLFCLFLIGHLRQVLLQRANKGVRARGRLSFTLFQKIELKKVNIFLPIILYICFGCSKEPSQSDGAFKCTGWVVTWFLFGYTARIFEYTVRIFYSNESRFLCLFSSIPRKLYTSFQPTFS